MTGSGLRPAREWMDLLRDVVVGHDVQMLSGRGGEPTLKVRDVFLHSQYRPREEAQKLVDSAQLDTSRPVIAIGMGLGYHLLELARRGMKVAAIEPDPAVAKLALDSVLVDSDIPIAVGDLDALSHDAAFARFSREVPQVLVHPPTARIHAEYCERAARITAHAALGRQRLRIAVVGPMYGGSLPIAGYIERAFRSLGHVTLLVDNSEAWPLYKAATEGTKTKRASAQLGNLFANFLNEWSYARVAEFSADICLVMAQAPVNAQFPARLAKDGVITAFWYVENWRHFPYWRDVAPRYDVFFHIQPGEFEQQLQEAGCPHAAFVQTACDPEEHKPVSLTEEEQARYECDLSFAGAGYYNRLQVFKGLTDFDFRIWGVDWRARELWPLLAEGGEARFTASDFARIVAGSKVNLNLHSSATHDGIDPDCDAINPRVFEIAACGGFQLCDPCRGLETLFDFDTELPVYRTLPELREKIAYYLAHPDERLAVAERARQRVLREHTYEHRARQMLDEITEVYGTRILRKGIRIQKTCGEVMADLDPDDELRAFLAQLPPDELFTHENMNDCVPRVGMPASYPEKMFAYLRDLRETAEMLLADRGLL